MNHVIAIAIIVLAYVLSNWFISKYVTKNEVISFSFSFLFTALAVNAFGAFLYYFGG